MKITVWQQFGAAIDMLENAITACPEGVWGKRFGFKEFLYIAFLLYALLPGSLSNGI